MQQNTINLGLAQISPVWLDKAATIQKIEQTILDASAKQVELLCFGEGLLPGYPFWLSFLHASEFESQIQKELHAHYINNAACIEEGDLDSICTLAKEKQIAIYLGIIERPIDRGGHSVYASLVYIDQGGKIQSVHRKLQPTYEERLSWSPGDGNGLVTHRLKDFTVGGLNCWENWMPLPRAALYGQGENLHVAVWPGSLGNTQDITRFIAKESRSFVVSVSSLLSKSEIPKDIPHYDLIMKHAPETMGNGGSCICGPDGQWIVEPVVNTEGIITCTVDLNKVYEERQNFDPAGHYSRPDVTQLHVNQARQTTVVTTGKMT